jgi:hypothetical protein
MCSDAATSREHVPPKSFFIPPFDKQLTWVPSCNKHNHGNSKDVEYARMIIPTALQTNEIARQIGAGKVIRTLKRTPKLWETLYKDAFPVTVNGEETFAYVPDRKRLRRVFEAMAFGLYYLHFGKKFYGGWWFFSPAMISARAIKTGQNDGLEPLREAFNRAPMKPVDTPHPDVFALSFYTEHDRDYLFRLRFYGHFDVFARGIPFYKTFQIPRGAF